MKKIVNYSIISNKIKRSVLFILFSGLSFLVNAQDTLVIYDVSGVLMAKRDTSYTTISAGGHRVPKPHQSPTEFNLSALFKVNQPQNVAEIYLKVGQTQDGTEFENKIFTVATHDSVLYTYSDSIQVNHFWGKSSSYTKVVLASDLPNVIWLTMYTKDLIGNYSEKKYFKIQ